MEKIKLEEKYNIEGYGIEGYLIGEKMFLVEKSEYSIDVQELEIKENGTYRTTEGMRFAKMNCNIVRYKKEEGTFRTNGEFELENLLDHIEIIKEELKN